MGGGGVGGEGVGNGGVSGKGVGGGVRVNRKFEIVCFSLSFVNPPTSPILPSLITTNRSVDARCLGL